MALRAAMTIAWITGGGTGIGRALADRLLRGGSKVVISGRRKDILDQTAKELADLPGGGEVIAMAGDASDPAHAKEVISRVKTRWGDIDLLVNNAGSNPTHELLETTFEEYLKSFEINCLSSINCTQAVLPIMRKAGRGSIVNISSIYGRWASSSSASYSVGKYAVTGYTDALRQALVGTSIHVLAVFPGFIQTDMTMPFVVSGSMKSRMGKTPDQTRTGPLRRLEEQKVGAVLSLVCALGSEASPLVSKNIRSFGSAHQALEMRDRLYCFFRFLFCLVSGYAAADFVEVSVETVQDNTSLVTLQTDIHAGQESVWGPLTDYDHHAGFLPYITKSRVLANDGEKQLIEQEGRIQILLWSYVMHMKQRVWEETPNHMHFNAIEGDFDVLQGDFYLTSPTALALKTHLVCEFIVKPKRRVPDWAVRMAAKYYLKKMVAVIAAKAEENQK